MSLLRQRATPASVESTLSAFSPALARLRLVSATRSAADEELNELVSQANVSDGAAKVNTELMPNRRAMARAVRRGDDARSRMRNVMRICVLRGCPGVFGWCGHGRLGIGGCPGCEGPVARGSQVPCGPVGSRVGASGWVWLGGVGNRGVSRGDGRRRSRRPLAAPAAFGLYSRSLVSAVAIAQWQSSGLWNRRLRVRAPLATPTPLGPDGQRR